MHERRDGPNDGLRRALPLRGVMGNGTGAQITWEQVVECARQFNTAYRHGQATSAEGARLAELVLRFQEYIRFGVSNQDDDPPPTPRTTT
jgi:hypothetical protein